MGPWLDAALLTLLGRVSADAQERRNILWYTISYLFAGCAVTLFGGELWNGFLEQAGYSMTRIGLLASIFSVANAIGLIVLIGLADRIRRPIRAYCMATSLTALAPVLTIAAVLVLPPARTPTGLLVALAAIRSLQALITVVPVTLELPVLSLAISPRIRARVLGIAVTTMGLLGAVLGLFSAQVLARVTYPNGYVWCFAAAAAAVALRAVAFGRMRELPALAEQQPVAGALPAYQALKRILRLPEFRSLAWPHVPRGMIMAATALILPAALQHLELPGHYPGYAASAATLGMVLGGAILSWIGDRLGPGVVTALADIAYALGFGLALLSPTPLAFLAIYLVMQIGRHVEDNAVPLGTMELVPPEYLAPVSAARIAVHMTAAAVGGIAFGYLFDHYSVVHVAALAGLIKVGTGVWLWRVFRHSPGGQWRRTGAMGLGK